MFKMPILPRFFVKNHNNPIPGSPRDSSGFPAILRDSPRVSAIPVKHPGNASEWVSIYAESPAKSPRMLLSGFREDFAGRVPEAAPKLL